MDLSRVPFVAAFGSMFAALAVAGLSSARSGTPPAAPGSDSAGLAWAEAIESGADHVDARELVRMLAGDADRVLLLDVRPAGEFEAFHLRGSTNLSLPRLLGDEGTALLRAHASRRPDGEVVLVSDGMTHPGQAWVGLARRGIARCRVLEDGIAGLRLGLLLPPALRGPTTEAAAKAAMAEHRLATRVLLGSAAEEPRGARGPEHPADAPAPADAARSAPR